MQLTTQLAGARKQAVRLQAEVEAAHEAQRSVVGAKQSELMQAQLKLSETEQLAELYRQALTNSTYFHLHHLLRLFHLLCSPCALTRTLRLLILILPLPSTLPSPYASPYQGLEEAKQHGEGISRRLAASHAALAEARVAAEAAAAAHAAAPAAPSLLEARGAPEAAAAPTAAAAGSMLALRSATAAADEAAAAAGEAGGQSGLYAKYQRAEEEARAAREEQAATEATLSQVLLEIDGKVPRILAQQQALHALRDEHEETTAKLAAAMHAGEAATERAAALQRMLDARDAQAHARTRSRAHARTRAHAHTRCLHGHGRA